MQILEVDFKMEAGSGSRYNMEVDFRGSFQCRGGLRGQVYFGRPILEAFVLLGVY
jgi:hypothetical protein